MPHISRQLHCLTSDAWNCDQAAVVATFTSWSWSHQSNSRANNDMADTSEIDLNHKYCKTFFVNNTHFLTNSSEISHPSFTQPCSVRIFKCIGRSSQGGFLDPGFMPHCTISPHLPASLSTAGVGVTKPIFSVPLFSTFSVNVKTNVSYWISS